jgi:hypothetical protein
MRLPFAPSSANHRSPQGGNREVVRGVQILLALALVEELQGVRRRQVAEDLPVALLAAGRVVEPDRAAAEPHAFEPLEPAAALRLGARGGFFRVDVLQTTPKLCPGSARSAL